MVVPRAAPAHQRQGPPGALPAPLSGLQQLPDECPHQAAPSVPAPYGHLTLTRTAPGPDSSGQGCSWGGRGVGDLPLSPALPVQGDVVGDSPSTSRRGNSQTRGSSCREREFRGARRAAPSFLVSSVRDVPMSPGMSPCPLRASLASPGHPVCVVHAGRERCVVCGRRDLVGGWVLLVSLCWHVGPCRGPLCPCQPRSRGAADSLPACPKQQEIGTAWAARAASAASAVPAAARAPRAPTGRAPASSLRTPG